MKKKKIFMMFHLPQLSRDEEPLSLVVCLFKSFSNQKKVLALVGGGFGVGMLAS